MFFSKLHRDKMKAAEAKKSSFPCEPDRHQWQPLLFQRDSSVHLILDAHVHHWEQRAF